MYTLLISYCLNLWLECIYPSWSSATGTKAAVLEGCQDWMSLTLSDTECPASNMKPSRFSSSGYSLYSLPGLLLQDSNQFLWHEETDGPLYTSTFSIHNMSAVAICSRSSSCLKCWIPSAWKLAFSMCISAWWHRDCSTWMRVWCWTIPETCGDAVRWYRFITYLSLLRRHVEYSSFIFFC